MMAEGSAICHSHAFLAMPTRAWVSWQNIEAKTSRRLWGSDVFPQTMVVGSRGRNDKVVAKADCKHGPHPKRALRVSFVGTVTKPERYCDGEGLYLLVTNPGARSWVQRLTIRGCRRDLRLGGFPWCPWPGPTSRPPQSQAGTADWLGSTVWPIGLERGVSSTSYAWSSHFPFDPLYCQRTAPSSLRPPNMVRADESVAS